VAACGNAAAAVGAGLNHGSRGGKSGGLLAADANGTAHSLLLNSEQFNALDNSLYRPCSLAQCLSRKTSSDSSGEAGSIGSSRLEMQVRRGQEQQQGDTQAEAGAGGGGRSGGGAALQAGLGFQRSTGRIRRGSDLSTLVEVSENSMLFSSAAVSGAQLNGSLAVHAQQGVLKWEDAVPVLAKGPSQPLAEGIELHASYAGSSSSVQRVCPRGYVQQQQQEQHYNLQHGEGSCVLHAGLLPPVAAVSVGAQAVAEGIEIQPLGPSAACGAGGLHRLSEEPLHPAIVVQQQQQDRSTHVLHMPNTQGAKLNDVLGSCGVAMNASSSAQTEVPTLFRLRDVFRKSRRNSKTGPPAGRRCNSLAEYSSSSAELVMQLRQQLSQCSAVSGSSFSFNSRHTVSFGQSNRGPGSSANGYGNSCLQQEHGLQYGDVRGSGRQSGSTAGGRDRRNSWHALVGGLQNATGEAAVRAGGSARGGNMFYRSSVGPCMQREREVAGSNSNSRRPSRGPCGDGVRDSNNLARITTASNGADGSSHIKASSSTKNLMKHSSSSGNVVSELEQQVMLEGGLHGNSSRAKRRSWLYDECEGPGAPAEFDRGVRIALPSSLVVAAAEAVGAGVGHSNQSLQLASANLSSPMTSGSALQRLMVIGGEDYCGNLFTDEPADLQQQQQQQQQQQRPRRCSRMSVDLGSISGAGNSAPLGVLLRHVSGDKNAVSGSGGGSRRHSISIEGAFGGRLSRRQSFSLEGGRVSGGINSARGLARQSIDARSMKQPEVFGPLGSLLRQVSLGGPSLAGAQGSNSAPTGGLTLGAAGGSTPLYKLGSGGATTYESAGLSLGPSSTGGSTPMGTVCLQGSSAAGGVGGLGGGSNSTLEALVRGGADGAGSGQLDAGTLAGGNFPCNQLLWTSPLTDLPAEAVSALQQNRGLPSVPWRGTSPAGPFPTDESPNGPMHTWHGSAAAAAAAAAGAAAAAFNGGDARSLPMRRTSSASAVALATTPGSAAAGSGVHSAPLEALRQGTGAAPGLGNGDHNSGPLALVFGAGPKAAEVCPDMPSVAPLPDQDMLQSLRMTGTSSRGPQSAHETEKGAAGFEGPSIGQTCSELMAGSWLWARQLLVHDLGTFK
jgi:hypothetical protein